MNTIKLILCFKDEIKNNSTNRIENVNETIISSNPSANITNENIFRDYEIDQADLVKTSLIQAPIKIDENLIKLDLHKTQSNTRSTSLYENFVKSATKIETKKETKKETNLNQNKNVDNLELNLSNLSLSSNDTSSSSSKFNASKISKPNSNIFENLTTLKKSDSFGSSKFS